MIVCKICGEDFYKNFNETYITHHGNKHEVQISFTNINSKPIINNLKVIFTKDLNTKNVFSYNFLIGKLVGTHITTYNSIYGNDIIWSLDELKDYKENLIFK